MPPKKTEGAAAPKAKSASTHASYQVCPLLSGCLGIASGTNRLQDMITDAIIAV